LAPSPTGAQHVGNARTYLIAWLSARTQGGNVVLRIEDIDSPRVKKGAAEEACADLRWLGLDWDEGPIFQTRRHHLYQAALKHLQHHELVYPCTCSRLDIERAASAPHAGQEGPTYPGTCSSRRAADARDLQQPYAWRFRTTPDCHERAAFQDGYGGLKRLTAQELGGDFVVWKAGDTPAYQLAVVVDDAAQGITEVVRGDDLVPSTPRQLLLYQALDLTPPAFVHVPLVVGPDGRRLAKRHGDTRLAALREAGVSAEELLGLFAWSCRWIAEIRPISARELLAQFRLETIPREPFVLTPSLLESIGYST
jgi:glutamyl-tRNA synthetase